MTLQWHVVRTPDELSRMAADWESLAHHSGSPFLTLEWVLPWWEAYGGEWRGTAGAFVLVGRSSSGTVRAGAFLQGRLGGRVVAATNVHSGEWDVVADCEASRVACWREMAGRDANRLRLAPLTEMGAHKARAALLAAGFTVFAAGHDASPRLTLPATTEEWAQSAHMRPRSEMAKRQRALRALGSLTFRTTHGGSTLDRDLRAFFELEAAGWKGRTGTAILADPRTTALYSGYASRAASAGSLRLHLLELDGRLLAAGLGCSYADGGFLIKSAYSEDYARYSPGLVLRGNILQSSVQEGLSFYDFLGSPAPHKLRWGAVPVQRWTIDAYRGPWRPIAAYRSHLRPALKVLRDRLAPTP